MTQPELEMLPIPPSVPDVLRSPRKNRGTAGHSGYPEKCQYHT